MSTVPASHFDELYEHHRDPYGFEDRWYERRKRALTLAALPREHYDRGFEPGCSLGHVTELLAPRCSSLLAVDVSERAVAAAAARVARFPGVQVRRGALPVDWPEGSIDLLVASELLYYFDDDDLDAILDRAAGSLRPGGTLLACHWRRPAPHPQTAETVHSRLRGLSWLALTSTYSDDDLVLDVFLRVPPEPRSVAVVDGIA